jgi:uridine kinase
MMQDMSTITATFEDSKIQIPLGSTVGDALKQFDLEGEMTTDYQANPYVCALVNNEVESFSDHLTCDSVIVPIRLFSDIGKRVYRQSICFLLYAAVDKLYPNRRLVIGFALGDGYYFTFQDRYIVSKETIATITKTMRDLSDQHLSIDKVTVPYDEALSYFKQKKFDETVGLLSTDNEPTVPLYQMDGFRDISYEPIVPNSGLITVWELRTYQQNGLLLRYPRSFDFTQLDTFKDNSKLFDALKHGKENAPIIQVSSIGDLSRLSYENAIAPFIRLSEEFQAKHIADIADAICQKSTVRFVAIAGPSSSGKTTFAFKLCTQLQVRGKKTLKITLDDYYLPPDQCPKDQDGKPDFERLEALNLPLLQHTLQAIQDGEEVSLPTYDFVQKKTTFGEKIKLDAKTIVVMEGIHGMNPALTGSLDSDLIFRVYISAFTQVNIDDHNRISTTDNRIIRRIVRDHRTRGASAEQTLSMIPSIQRGENLYIFPYQGNADMMINSALDYELAVLAPFAQPLLKMVKPSATVVYVTARRLLKFLDNFQPIPDTLVPSDSLLREFIGGSEYGVT